MGIINLDLEIIKPTQKYLKLNSLEKILRCYREGNGFLVLPSAIKQIDDNYLIVDGHNRLAIAKYLGYKNISFYELGYFDTGISRKKFPEKMHEAIEASNLIIKRRSLDKIFQDRNLVESRGIVNIEDVYGYDLIKEIDEKIKLAA